MAESQTFLSFRRPGQPVPPQQKPKALTAEEFRKLGEVEESPAHSPISPESLRPEARLAPATVAKIAEAEERNRQAEAEFLAKTYPHARPK